MTQQEQVRLIIRAAGWMVLICYLIILIARITDWITGKPVSWFELVTSALIVSLLGQRLLKKNG